MGATAKVDVRVRVKQLRAAKGLTQAALAMRAGVHPETITKVESWGLVTWRTAKRIGDVLGVDPRELVTRE
jgi:DNA-binding XRE family transcriptional regulator